MQQPWIGLTSGLSMMALSSPLLLRQHDEQREHFRENRDAFEQEERKVDGAGDLRGRARLAGNALGSGGGQLADAKACTDDDHAQNRGLRRRTRWRWRTRQRRLRPPERGQLG